MLVEKLLLKDLIRELREEIKEEAETFVIAKCKEQYRRLLLTGPFTTKETGLGDDMQRYQEQQEESKRAGRKQDNDIIKDRERNVVMGVTMH